MKKLIALLLTIVMLLGAMSTVAFATGTEDNVDTTVTTTDNVENTDIETGDANVDNNTENEGTEDKVDESQTESVEDEHDHEHELTTGEVTAVEKEDGSSALRVILIIVQVLCSIALVAIVMMQTGKESGMGVITGSSDSYMSKNKGSSREARLATLTKWIAALFMVLTLVLCLID